MRVWVFSDLKLNCCGLTKTHNHWCFVEQEHLFVQATWRNQVSAVHSVEPVKPVAAEDKSSWTVLNASSDWTQRTGTLSRISVIKTVHTRQPKISLFSLYNITRVVQLQQMTEVDAQLLLKSTNFFFFLFLSLKKSTDKWSVTGAVTWPEGRVYPVAQHISQLKCLGLLPYDVGTAVTAYRRWLRKETSFLYYFLKLTTDPVEALNVRLRPCAVMGASPRISWCVAGLSDSTVVICRSTVRSGRQGDLLCTCWHSDPSRRTWTHGEKEEC